MPNFSYKVRDKAGKIQGGTLEAENTRALAEKLRGMGFFITSIKEEKTAAAAAPGAKSADIFEIFKKPKARDLVVFSHQLATMIGAGLTLTASLGVLADQVENKQLQAVVVELRRDVEEGNSFSSALEKHPKVFIPIFINMVRAGEASGNLEAILNRIAVFAEEAEELKSEVKNAMTYPVIMVVLAMGVVAFLVGYVFPKFAVIFMRGGIQLPWPTRFLLGLSSFIKGGWYYVLGAIILLVIGIYQIKRTPGGKLFFDKVKLKIPVFGPLLQKLVISRFAQTLSTLITSGVPILQSLRIVQQTIGNLFVSQGIDTICESVNKGRGLAEPMRDNKMFPPMVGHMTAVGEETGTLDEILSKIHEFYDKEVKYSVKKLTTMLEPFLIIGVGVVIGFIAIALFLPMFDMTKAIK